MRCTKRAILTLLFLLLAAPASATGVLTPAATDGWAGAETVVAKADVSVTSSATVVANANGNRVFLSCTNTHATVHVRWGDSTVTATKGQQLRAGRSIEIKNRDVVYMISEGATVTVACTEETR